MKVHTPPHWLAPGVLGQLHFPPLHSDTSGNNFQSLLKYDVWHVNMFLNMFLVLLGEDAQQSGLRLTGEPLLQLPQALPGRRYRH